MLQSWKHFFPSTWNSAGIRCFRQWNPCWSWRLRSIVRKSTGLHQDSMRHSWNQGTFHGAICMFAFPSRRRRGTSHHVGLSKEHAASVIGLHDQTLDFHDIVRELTGCLNFSVCCSVSTIEDGYLPSFPSHCVGEETIAEHVHAHGLHENIYIVLWSEWWDRH